MTLIHCSSVDTWNIKPTTPSHSQKTRSSYNRVDLHVSFFSNMGSFHSTSRGIEDPIFSFWFGDRIPRTSRLLPTCWDELLDWTNEASRIFETYANRNNDEFQSTVTDKQHCAGEIHETHPLTAAPTESKSPTQDTPVTIRFVPLVLNDQVSALQNLHAMERFDQRGKFYAEHVSVEDRYASSF